MPTALIFDIQRFCTGDGPGIRTTVFLKGCPLSCVWCHNPESKRAKPELAFYSARCVGCGRCVRVCLTGAMGRTGQIDRAVCHVCGRCADGCEGKALEIVGREMTIEEVMGKVVRDKLFYESSGGGVTVSGGEPLHQAEFTVEVLEACRVEGVHNAVETCGLASWDILRRVAQAADLVLFDIKVADAGRHKELCGASNEQIISNLRKLSEEGTGLLLRYPLVPGVNDSADDIRELGELVLSLPNVHALQLMPYHGAGSSKYSALGLEPPDLPDILPDDALACAAEALRAMGVELPQ